MTPGHQQKKDDDADLAVDGKGLSPKGIIREH